MNRLKVLLEPHHQICLVLYSGNSLRWSYPFADGQSLYSTAPADWARKVQLVYSTTPADWVNNIQYRMMESKCISIVQTTVFHAVIQKYPLGRG